MSVGYLGLVMMVGCGLSSPQWKEHQLGELRGVELSAFDQPAMSLSTQTERHVRSQCPTVSSSRLTTESDTLSLLEIRGSGLNRVRQVVATLPNGGHATLMCDYQLETLRCPVVGKTLELYLGFSISGITAACVGEGYSFRAPL